MANTSTIQIVLNTTAAQQNANQLNNSVNNIGSSAASTGFALNKLAAAIGSVFAVAKLKQYADAYTSIQNQIRRTTDNQEQLNQTTRDLLSLANETRADLGATTELYTSLAISTKNLGLSQQQVFGITKTINNLFLESGKSAEETAGAIRQLGQAFDKGKLNGDEFVSVAEGAPGILRAIQLETGKTRDQLALMAEKGLLSAELLTVSLQKYGDVAQAAADKTKATLGQAFTIAGNNATFFVGEVNSAAGATSSLAQTIIDLSNSLSSQENIDNFILFFKQASKSISDTTTDMRQFANEFELLSDIGGESVGLIGRSFRDLVPNIKASVQVIVVEVASFIDKISAKFKQFDDYLSNFLDGDNAEKSLSNYENKINAINSARDESIQQIFRERDAIIESSKAEIKAKNDAAAAGGGKNSNFGNASTPKADVETAEQLKARKKNEQARIDLIKQVEAEIEAEGKRMDIADREIAGAQSVTAQLKIELDKRLQISQIYRDQAKSIDQGYYEEQRANLKARELEEFANIQAGAAEQAQKRQEQLRQALENENLEASEKLRIKAEYDLQDQLQAQINEEQMTAIKEKGKRAREELDRAEFQARLDSAGALGNALMTLGQGQSKKIFKIGQTLALAQAAVALPTAVMESFKNGGGYPWGLVPAATMLATGLKNIQSIKSAGAGLGGGGGGGSISASIGGGSGIGTIPTTSSSPDTMVQQKRIYDLRGVKADDKISISAMAALLEDDGAVVMIENAREDAARRNVIGVTAR
jgi:tape measure domain-containing protein